jgi:hypothetical protein
MGDPMKPGGQRFGLANRTGFVGEDEKSGLAGILGVLLLPEHTPANAQHHGPMPLYQGRECRLIATACEIEKELAVGQPERGPDPGHRSKAADNALELRVMHERFSSGAHWVLSVVPTRRKIFTSKVVCPMNAANTYKVTG